MFSESVTQLKHAYASGRTRPLAWRRAQLDALRRMIAKHTQDFIAAETADLGKPAAETVLMELNLVSSEARFVRHRLRSWTARHPQPMPWALQPAAGWTIAEPKGVVLIIAPWNYPVLLALEPLADALAAGNAVCIKPSELAPHTSQLIAKLVPRYLDGEAITVVEGGAEETGRLLECEFDHIFYTGGERVGKIVMTAAAKHLTPVTLELGGKSPCFVDSTVNLNVAARRIAWGKFSNAGQTCVAPDYVLATADIAQALAERIALAVTEFYGENPAMSPDYGRIVNDRHFDRLCGLMSDGRVVCGGTADREARYIAPTVLLGTRPDAPVMQEEIFGPILPILVVEDVESAIRFINDRPHPLAAYVFSNRRAVRRAFECQTSSGALGYSLTLAQLLSSRLPFGGVGASGMGAYHGKAGFDTMSHIKTVVSKPQFPDTLQMIYPPLHTVRTALITLLSKLS
ncbi:aldehyde dehydrogenase family protein [Bifidobacterium saguini]|uniref:Aldehyde dehydrogenase n=1 Tax=Bifidobacterium saguini TaxID=762210 RepID=A0ABX7SG24_9BIFI|nr:aldehyde dehydrogenase family protein [Bifidobacterium saguini]QTB92049.1 aldehyde dehydrogenase family protein [Bifidobacterium saguini]